MRLFFWPFPPFQSMRAQQSAAWAGDEDIKEAKKWECEILCPHITYFSFEKVLPWHAFVLSIPRPKEVLSWCIILAGIILIYKNN
jgi:hypothetical protein